MNGIIVWADYGDILFIAYFLNESKQKVLKLVRKHEDGCFERKGFTYNINPDAVMWKRCFGVKLVRFIDYFENNPNPIVYDFDKKEINIDSVYINSAVKTIKKMLNWWIEYATLGVSVLTMIVVLYFVGSQM